MSHEPLPATPAATEPVGSPRARTDWNRAALVVFAAAAVTLIVLRKPWALHTPQLYAEDGSIFLAFNDLDGAKALLEPYMGYLHTIPRLTAWAASHLVDPAWWPAFYNWTAFAGILAVIGRTFSSRLALPGKPWLAAAFFLGPQTSEVFFTITNLQWFTALLLVEQAIIAPPRCWRERLSDLLVVALIGVTGPFIIAFWPLLAWRWWRDRRGDNLAVLVVATTCACIQGYFVLRTGPHFDFPPFAPGRFFAVLGQHFFAWPLVGADLAVRLPGAVLAVLGLVPTVVLLARAFRPDPLRSTRLVLVAAFALIVASLVYRSRPDTWSLDNLIFGERYFFIPRLLLYWLLILEFDAAARGFRWAARIAAVLIVLVNLKDYAPPPPTDYHWADHCDPIRRGVPANIPTLPEGWTLEYRGRPHQP